MVSSLTYILVEATKLNPKMTKMFERIGLRKLWSEFEIRKTKLRYERTLNKLEKEASEVEQKETNEVTEGKSLNRGNV